MNLPGWVVDLGTQHSLLPLAEELVPTWSDGICSVFRLSADPERALYRYKYGRLAEAEIDFNAMTVRFSSLSAGSPNGIFEHFLLDIIQPRILDWQGKLVVHAGSAQLGEQVVLFIGNSGAGKSTLTASFYAAGFTTMSDDCVVIDQCRETLMVKAVYPGIRLLPDTLQALFPRETVTTEYPDFFNKRRIVPDGGMTAASCRLSALFFISDPTEKVITVRPMSAAECCMGLIRQAFALDPSKSDRAVTRMKQVATVANKVPAFKLCYPRDVAFLPMLHSRIFDSISV